MPYSKEQSRVYFQTHNIPNICACGGSFKKYFKKAHETTQKHQTFVKQQEAEKKKTKKQTTADVLKELQITINNLRDQLLIQNARE